MIRFRLAALATLALVTTPAWATKFHFTMRGFLPAATGIGGESLVDDAPVVIRANFDDSSTNLVKFPFGFVAYAPSYATLTTGGLTYRLKSYDPLTQLGISVALFDATTPFGLPGRYAAGIIQDPAKDGTGIVLDLLPTSPFDAHALSAHDFAASSFFGIGYSPGYCTSKCRKSGETHSTESIPMSLNGVSHDLTPILGDFTYIDYAKHAPPPYTSLRWSAALTSVAEPSALALVALGAAALGVGRRRAHT